MFGVDSFRGFVRKFIVNIIIWILGDMINVELCGIVLINFLRNEFIGLRMGKRWVKVV